MNEKTSGSSIPVRNATAATPPKNDATLLRLWPFGTAKIIAIARPGSSPIKTGKYPDWKTPACATPWLKALMSPLIVTF